MNRLLAQSWQTEDYAGIILVSQFLKLQKRFKKDTVEKIWKSAAYMVQTNIAQLDFIVWLQAPWGLV